MKKISSINSGSNKISNKIIDLCLCFQIEDSHQMLKMIDLQIKSCILQIELLKENKPLRFQRKKLKLYNDKINELENKINKYYLDMDEEVLLIEKMTKSISIAK